MFACVHPDTQQLPLPSTTCTQAHICDASLRQLRQSRLRRSEHKEGQARLGREKAAVVMVTDKDASLVTTRRWDGAKTLQVASEYHQI